MNNRQFDQKLISADNQNTWTMDPVNLNEASKDELKKLPGCGKAVTPEMIRRRKTLQHYLTEGDMKLSANYWKQLFNEGMVTFEAP